MQVSTFLIASFLFLPFMSVFSLPFASPKPTSPRKQLPLSKALTKRMPDWPSLPYSPSFIPQDDKFKAVKLTFRTYGPVISNPNTNATKIINALRSAIESQKPLGQLRQDVSAIGNGLRARFSLPPGRSISNTWYCLTALEALQAQFNKFGVREIKADVYDTGKVAVNIGTIVIAQGDTRNNNVIIKADRRKRSVRRRKGARQKKHRD